MPFFKDYSDLFKLFEWKDKDTRFDVKKKESYRKLLVGFWEMRDCIHKGRYKKSVYGRLYIKFYNIFGYWVVVRFNKYFNVNRIARKLITEFYLLYRELGLTNIDWWVNESRFKWNDNNIEYFQFNNILISHQKLNVINRDWINAHPIRFGIINLPNYEKATKGVIDALYKKLVYGKETLSSFTLNGFDLDSYDWTEYKKGSDEVLEQLDFWTSSTNRGFYFSGTTSR